MLMTTELIVLQCSI